MPNVRRQPTAPPSASVLVAVADPAQPGLYTWETGVPVAPGTSPVIRTTATGVASVTVYDTKVIIEKTGFITGMRLSAGVVPGGQSLLANLQYNGGVQIFTSLAGPSVGPGGSGVGVTVAPPGGPFAVNVGDYVLVQNEQVGSSPAGSDINYDIFTT